MTSAKHSASPPRCSDPARGALLARYEFGVLSEAERREFEGHLLACDACFDELERGSAVAAELRSRASLYQARLRRRRRLLPALGEMAGQAWKTLAPPWPKAWPAVPITGLVLAAVITGLYLQSGPRRAARLASFPTEAVETEVLRGAEVKSPVDELLAAGGAHFDLGQYSEAERRLRAAAAREPERFDAVYLLGLSLALQNRAKESIPFLERASRLAAGVAMRQKAEWTLANAYLKTGHIAEARERLEVLAREEGDYPRKARELRRRLPH